MLEEYKIEEPMRRAVHEAQEMYGFFEARCLKDLTEIVKVCAGALAGSGRLFFCGNGGSAAESQHLATELVVRLSADVVRPALPAIALTTDTSILTACGNDFGFDAIFARQVEAHMRKGDVLVLLSTSGRSQNLIEAAKVSHDKQAINIGFLGKDKTSLDSHLDYSLHIPTKNSQRVQEAHLFFGHLLIQLIETQMKKTK